MVQLKLSTLESSTKQEIIYTLEEIIEGINNDYHSGITSDGTCWSVEGEEEIDDDDWE